MLIATSAGECVKHAVAVCTTGPQMNMALRLRLPTPTSDSLIDTYRKDAEAWQAEHRPTDLKFNHGEYLHRHGDAVGQIIGELRKKSTSNRACTTLISASDIAASGDGVLPSFVALQAGFQQASQQVIYLTAYFRALEVGHFLPINLAELALIADRLAENFPTVGTAEITLFAFRAHLNSGFGVHRIAKLDTLAEVEVAELVNTAITSGNWSSIVDLLTEKRSRESIVNAYGVALLNDAFETSRSTGHSADLDVKLRHITRLLGSTLETMKRLAAARAKGTFGPTLEKLQEIYEDQLDRTIQELRN